MIASQPFCFALFPLVLEKAVSCVFKNIDGLVSFSYRNSFSSEGEGSE